MPTPLASFEQDVFPAELEEIAARRAVVGRPAPPADAGPHADVGLVGLALSGGGIRSATFALGAIQGLARAGAFRALDYISTVSGGGFIGGCVSSLMNDPAAGTDPDRFPLRAVHGGEEAAAVRHVRNSANYLAPGGLLDRIRIPALLVRGVLMNGLALVPYLMLAAMATQFYYSADLDTWVAGVVASLAVFLFVVLLFMTKVATSRFSWTWRNRYESWLSTSFLLLLVLVTALLVPSLVAGARDLTLAGLRSKLAWLVSSPDVLWRALLVIAGAALLAAAAQFSATAARVRSTLLLYGFGLLGPVVVLAGYLLVCVVYLEPRWLETTAFETALPENAGLLDYGYVPAALAGKLPQALDACKARRLDDGSDPGERYETACGATYRVSEHRAGGETVQSFHACDMTPPPEELARIVADLQNTQRPAALKDHLFFDGGDSFTLDEVTDVEPRGEGSWALRHGRHTLVLSRQADALSIAWEAPYEAPDPDRPWPFGRLAHVHKVADDRWTLTSSGRNFEIVSRNDRLVTSWDLATDLDREVITDALRSAFRDKSGLPDALAVEFSESGGARWLLKPIGGEPPPAGSATSVAPPGDGTIVARVGEAGSAEAGPGGIQVEFAGAEPPPIEVRREQDRYSTTKRPEFMSRDIDFGFLALALLGLVFYNGLFLNVNASAFHGFYRDRLSQAYLIRRPQADGRQPGSNDGQKLSTLNAPGSAAPYHLINVALNLNGMTEPDMRGRQSDFFVFSKRYTGCPRTGFCRTADLERVHRHLDLGTAMAISGAAAAPNAGTATLKPLVFLLTLLNVRLGYWLPHPARVSARWWTWTRLRLLAGVGARYLWLEAIGGVSSRAPYVNLSDGGHIENLGVYPLLRRRCKVIVVVDGEQDPRLRFGSLMQLMMFARIDLGADIAIDLDEMRPGAGLPPSHVAVGRIDYGGGEHGWLVYVKSSLTGDEGPLIRDYAENHPDFPHQPTSDQFFNERQFEMYRALGEHIVDDLFAQLRGNARHESTPARAANPGDPSTRSRRRREPDRDAPAALPETADAHPARRPRSDHGGSVVAVNWMPRDVARCPRRRQGGRCPGHRPGTRAHRPVARFCASLYFGDDAGTRA